MRIELMEGDGFLYEDGKARNVIVVIDGKNQFPFSATATIQDLYEAVKKINPGVPFSPGPFKMVQKIANEEKEILLKPSEIERLDTVQYIGKPDDEGDLIPGELYLVQEIIKDNGKLAGYAILNEKVPTPIRLTVAAFDVRLEKKHGPAPEKISTFEIIHLCPPPCGKEFALTLKDNKYVGDCPYCHTHVESDRSIVAPETVSTLQ